MSQPQPRETYFDNLLYVVIPNEDFKLVQFNNIPPMFLLTYLKIIKVICLFVISLIYSKIKFRLNRQTEENHNLKLYHIIENYKE